MSIVTNWGYTLPDLDVLPDLLIADEFHSYTAYKYAGGGATGEARVVAELKAASAAIRDYCGWHVSPSASCSMSEHLLYGNGRVKRVANDLMIQLPAKFVSAVSQILIGEAEHTDFALETNGILHVFDVNTCGLSRKMQITVNYTAGIGASGLGAVKELAAHMATHALAVPAGITSEAAGGVSVTYNAHWANSTRATALPDDSKDVLAPYRIQGVF